MLSKLNPKQREAVEHTEGPLLILAGAGSGKTRVLTYRMAYLMAEKGIDPFRLLAVTFTNKAAFEMKTRVEKLLGLSIARDIWVMTFHSACLRILRRHKEDLGYSSDFTIYDDYDQLQVINQCLDELGLNPKMFHPKAVSYRINQAKHNAVTAEDYPSDGLDFFEEKVAKIYPLYQQKLRLNQAMDFGDLILNVLVLFRQRPAVLTYYQERFSYIHVDEYQDTNRCQYELIKLLSQSHRNLCVVGDDDQSIYRFRGAEIRNILDFQKDYPEAHVVRLEQNYRSTRHILKAASSVVAKNRDRMGKTLWTENTEGEKLTLFQGLTEKDEASFVVGEIIKERAKRPYSEMVIFYRTHAQSRPFEDELRRNRIPYVIIGGMKFYERQEIKDILAYLKILVNPADALSLKRVINVPARGIGKTTFEKLEAEASSQKKSLWDVLTGLKTQGLASLSGATVNKLLQFINLIQELSQKRKEIDLVDFMAHLYEATGYWKMLEEEQTIEAQGRMENLEEFVNVISEYARAVEAPTLEGFLDQASLASDADENTSEDKLPLMTLHLAKGLEFPVVFMVGLEEGLFPHSRSLDTREDIEEERRLCYVGMTRAQEKLTLSFVRERRLFGSNQYNLPSRFLEEIPEDLLDRRGMSYKAYAQEAEEEDGGYTVDYSYDQSVSEVAPSRRSLSPFRRGAKVRHPVFGVGTIRALEGEEEGAKLTIAFSNGQIKKILAKYANLEMM